MSMILAGTAVLGAIQGGVGLRNLISLSKQRRPNYSITPEQRTSYSQAMNNARFGFTPAQTGAFMNNINSSQNAAYNQAINISGGQQANAISRVLQGNRLGAYNQFAAQDASLKLQNQRYADQMGQQITNQRNLIDRTLIDDRNRQEEAWGGAMQSGMTNIASALNFQGIVNASGRGDSSGGKTYSSYKPPKIRMPKALKF